MTSWGEQDRAPVGGPGTETANLIRVPAQAAAGEAAVIAMPHNIDWCDDAGRNNRAQGTAGMERASCTEPRKPLTIALTRPYDRRHQPNATGAARDAQADP
ncbi:hypothetical protein I6N91_16770 [Arthrobacter sp. MSA 4-2]|uniref:hypothetical protein n=1 Tax=Arthrobacter sp. MSA 4-2 TaxID=2794349 RepID=UPI0018E77ACD|nr:hypothetical protein [Arthrobacter sp. MSA 4-2]MBJ2122632.1 hypothetical protein [Arthrobacter sp. MSA 4-2]